MRARRAGCKNLALAVGVLILYGTTAIVAGILVAVIGRVIPRWRTT